MTLADLHTGESAVIVKVSGRGSFRKRIIEMGFIKGKTVRVVQNAPLMDPVEYEILGYRLTLRRAEARLIEVVSEEVARAALREQQAYTPLADEAIQAIVSEAEVRSKMRSMATEQRKTIRVALVGNPNCGKTTIFNVASGAHEHVGNYSGVTVDAHTGTFKFEGYTFLLTDLPGTYSLSSYSPEEVYVRKHIVEDKPDVVLNVLDASNLERSLYLTTQLIDLDLRLVLALNMYDEVQERGDRLDHAQLGLLLGAPAVPVVGRKGEGVQTLFRTIIRLYEDRERAAQRHIHIGHGGDVEAAIASIQSLIKENPSILAEHSSRYMAIKLLENDAQMNTIVTTLSNAEEIRQIAMKEQVRLEALLGDSSETYIVDAKYGFINGLLKEVLKRGDNAAAHTMSDKIDLILTNRYLGFPLFLFFLYVIFQLTFTLGQYPMDWIDAGISWLSEIIAEALPEGAFKDMVIDGALAGVGAVVVFLPNILILYFCISFLEDTGYMARAAFIMDRLMHKMGLHGKSFIPMIMGFGCNVPAVMATRAIESPSSRLITMLVTPLMSCSARLPIYIVIIGAFFAQYRSLVLLSLYVGGILVAVLCARLFKRYLVHEDDLPFVMELPPYRLPVASAVWKHAWEKGKQYLKKMATIILMFSIVVWFLGYYPQGDYATDSERQEQSYIGRMGHAIEPIMSPLGFDWRMSVAILSGVGAKEVVVSTMGVIYSVDKGDLSEDELAEDATLQDVLRHSMTPAAALAFLVFVLLYVPCIATVAAIKKESGSRKWAVFSVVYTTTMAWLMAFLVYHIALLLA